VRPDLVAVALNVVFACFATRSHMLAPSNIEFDREMTVGTTLARFIPQSSMIAHVFDQALSFFEGDDFAHKCGGGRTEHNQIAEGQSKRRGSEMRGSKGARGELQCVSIGFRPLLRPRH